MRRLLQLKRLSLLQRNRRKLESGGMMIKIDVVSGFLGAGKTTFIKQLINENVFSDQRIVILENEYGEVNIDSQFLGESMIPIYEINKGCICCSLKDDFVMTLIEIKSLNPDRIIIEPSGIFMLETLHELLNHELLKNAYYLNSVISIIDTTLFDGRFIPMSQLIGNQIRYANRVVLSKYIGSNEQNVENALDFIKENNEDVEAIKWDPNMSILPFIDHLFDTKDNSYDAIPNRLSEDNEKKDSHDHHSSNRSHQQFQSETIIVSQSIKEDTFKAFIDSLKEGSFGDIIRMKGYLIVEGVRYECQYASGNFEYEEISNSPLNALVLIGNDINRKDLSEIF